MSKEKFKRKIRRAAAAIAALALAVSITFPAGTDMSGISFGNAIVASAVESGTCGDGVTWTLDDAGKLTISYTGSGSGAMDNWFGSNKAPWYNSYRGSIKTVVIERGVTSIGNYAFYGCSNIESISIEDSVTSIGKGAFIWCSKLTSITIPNSVNSIGENAFLNCTSLTSINVNDDNQNYCSVDGVLFNKSETTLVAYPNGKGASYDIPNGVTSIGEGAFYCCSSLTSITIPDGVTSIGDYAFNYCSNLTSITIPNSVTSIGEGAFVDCRSLTSITIPNSVNSIGDYAFDSCTSLTSITIPNSVNSIGNNPFESCYNLTSIFLPQGLNVTDAYIPSTATQIKYTVTDNTVTITEVIPGYNQTSVDIPEKISGYPVVFVVEAYRRYVGDHTCAGGTATCTAKAVCGLCGQEYGSVSAHDHSGEWQTNEDEHWKVCADENCDEIIDKAEHTFDEGVITKEATEYEEGEKTYTCQLCGYQTTKPVSKLDHTHKESTDLMSDVNGHWHVCTECGEKLDYAEHTFDEGVITKEATVDEEGEKTFTCQVCGYEKTETIAKLERTMQIDPIIMGAFANSYIYSYDSDMNKITMNKTRKPGVITVDLGKKYAGKTVTLYEGKNSTEVKVTEGVLDANGKLTFTVDSGKNYTLVVGD